MFIAALRETVYRILKLLAKNKFSNRQNNKSLAYMQLNLRPASLTWPSEDQFSWYSFTFCLINPFKFSTFISQVDFHFGKPYIMHLQED